jgi:hypothetical protein
MWIFLAIAAPFLVYGLHRLCLHLEDRGYLYYWHKQPKPGGTAPFLLSQEFYQPQVSQIIEAEDHSTEKADVDRYLPDALHPARWQSNAPRSANPEDPRSH